MHAAASLRPTVLAMLLTGVLAAPAAATTRYAAPGASASSGCTQAAPCSLVGAVGAAATGDDVAVTSGDYAVSSSISPTTRMDIHGIAGEPRPRLLGSSSLTAAVVSAKQGGTVSDLYVASAGSGQALELQGGVGDDLVLVASSTDAVKLVGAPAGTLLRDTLARTLGSSSYAINAKDGATSSTGPVDLRNVTAIADAGGTGFYSQMSAAVPTLRNVIARGTAADIVGKASTTVDVARSAFRSTATRNITDSGANTGDDPRFADPANGDFHLLAGSPAIDSGVVDSLVGAVDADGLARIAGPAPDMGAYEFRAPGSVVGTTGVLGAPMDTGSATATGNGTGLAAGGPQGGSVDLEAPVLPGSPPKAGKSINVAPAAGKVRVKLPGAKGYVTLSGATGIPVGATVDARSGAVVLASARSAAGATQNAVFSGGAFQVRQDKGTALATALVLSGGSFGGCATKTTAKRAFRVATAAAERKPGKHVVRQLWARDKGGRFRTDGRYASALVRGTVWLTQDRCDGTLVRVSQGKVLVHDRVKRMDVLVKAGHSYLARPRR